MAHEIIDKIEVHCEECGNDARIYTFSNEEIAFCPFCGEPIVLDYADEEESEEDAEDDEDWPVGGC